MTQRKFIVLLFWLQILKANAFPLIKEQKARRPKFEKESFQFCVLNATYM